MAKSENKYKYSAYGFNYKALFQIGYDTVQNMNEVIFSLYSIDHSSKTFNAQADQLHWVFFFFLEIYTHSEFDACGRFQKSWARGKKRQGKLCSAR